MVNINANIIGSSTLRVLNSGAGPDISLVQTKLNTSSAGGVATMVFNSQPTAGNLMIIIVGCSDEGSFIAPGGWTLIKNVDISGKNFSFAIYSKVAGASEANSYAFTSTPFVPGFNYSVGFEFIGGVSTTPVCFSNTALAVQSITAGSSAVNAAVGDFAIVVMMTSGIMGGSGIPAFDSGFGNVQDGLASNREFDVARLPIISNDAALNCGITWATARDAGSAIVLLKK